MPLLKREPEIWPANLFGEPGGDTVDPVTVRASAALHRPPRPALVGGAARQPDRWWVAHTRSRQEKALARHLLHCEVPYYLPQREHRLRAGDRWRTSHLPLFPGYVFFHGDLQDRLLALRSNVVAKLIPAPAPGELARELRSLWLLQMTGEPLVPHPYIAPGDEVEILAGALRGYRGVVLRDKGRYRLVVSITLLRQSVATEIDRDVLAPIALRKVG
ncbi:MAG TPA: transcription termination/antitermination NusG family protein [Thermoanaerobaculia bacterium]|nr:transcription termination/antitermination NusG family protein [Thermoanaerobaculia bacterium]